ncbi:hypothetical protein AB0M54_10105 [Actinoplanes sp. NPDC051470]|uniref:hypothetical protein n=1 Tax=unclassified Actinoplanes TaxID=2626549 RepID=UPI00343DEF58
MTVQQMVRDAMEGAAGESVEVKAAVGAAAAAQSIPTPTTSDTGMLWRILVVALSVILVIALAGIIWTVVDGNEGTSPDVIVTVFSSALSGMLGLFVKSPN